MKNKFKRKRYLDYLFYLSAITFVLNKVYIRKIITEEYVPHSLRVISYSIPNLLEAVIGTILLTTSFTWIAFHFWKDITKERQIYINLIGLIASSTFVILGETNLHDFGGSKIYDPNDIIASIIGLIMTFSLIQKYGIFKKGVKLKEK